MSSKISRALLIFFLIVLSSLGLILFLNERNIVASATHKQARLSPTKVVELYYDLSLKGEFEKANKLITNTDGVVSSSKAYHTENAKIIYEGQIDIRKILCESIKGKNATVIAQVSDDTGHVYRQEHALYQENGDWKIWGIMMPEKSSCE
jgi:hypothetical protein